MLTKVKPYAKAVAGAAVAGLSAYGTALADGTVTSGEWVGVALAAVAAGAAVFGVPNKPAPGGGA
jgi:hypothetical protein